LRFGWHLMLHFCRVSLDGWMDASIGMKLELFYRAGRSRAESAEHPRRRPASILGRDRDSLDLIVLIAPVGALYFATLLGALESLLRAPFERLAIESARRQGQGGRDERWRCASSPSYKEPAASVGGHSPTLRVGDRSCLEERRRSAVDRFGGRSVRG